MRISLATGGDGGGALGAKVGGSSRCLCTKFECRDGEPTKGAGGM